MPNDEKWQTARRTEDAALRAARLEIETLLVYARNGVVPSADAIADAEEALARSHCASKAADAALVEGARFATHQNHADALLGRAA